MKNNKIYTPKVGDEYICYIGGPGTMDLVYVKEVYEKNGKTWVVFEQPFDDVISVEELNDPRFHYQKTDN